MEMCKVQLKWVESSEMGMNLKYAFRWMKRGDSCIQGDL